MRKVIVLIILALIATFGNSLARDASQKHSDPSFKLSADQSYNGYRVRTFFDDEQGGGYFEILHNGERIYSQKGFKFRIGLPYTDAEYKELGTDISNDVVRIGKDITGKGKPNLVINEWTGGMHCCFKFHIFEIGKHFRKVATLDARHGDLSHFKDLRGNKKPVFVAADWTFAYWHTGFVQSPAPEIILSYQGNSYKLDCELMRKPAPSQKEIEDKIKEVQKDKAWQDEEAPPVLWDYMLDLIYSGNADLAWNFFDKAWRPGISGKAAFKTEFQSLLKKSPYWNQIRKMNRPDLKVSNNYSRTKKTR